MQDQQLSFPLIIFNEVAKKAEQIFFAFDPEAGKFIYINQALGQLFGIPVEEAVARPAIVSETVHPKDQEYLTQIYKEVLAGAAKKDIEFRIQFSDTEEKWICLTPFLVEPESGKKVIAGFAEDKTKSRRSEETLRRYAAKKDSVLEILAHDLAGPLNNISGASSMLADDLKDHTDAHVIKMVKIIEETSKRSINLIRDFVQQEFLESENSEMVKERVDVVKKMNEIINQYKESEKEIQKNFSLKTSGDSIFVLLDDYKFSQVINNLISNSIKFTPDGGNIELSVEEKDDRILVSVTDDGIGIPEKYHSSLFDKFTKARRKGLKGEPSTGLGMSIIKTIIDWHRGTIWFKSKENEGTVFYIEMPKE